MTRKTKYRKGGENNNITKNKLKIEYYDKENINSAYYDKEWMENRIPK